MDKTLQHLVGKEVTLYGEGFMKPTRAFGQRKVYGLVRVSLAMTRLSKAKTKAEKEKAGDWLAAWVAFGGFPRSKADRKVDKEGRLGV